MSKIFRLPALALVLACILCGCSRSPRVHFYTLAPAALPSRPVDEAAPSIAVTALTLPDMVNRPQLVLRLDDARVDVLEQHHWAEPLKSALARAIAVNLAALTGAGRVAAYPQTASSESDYRVMVDFHTIESGAGQVRLDALWTIRTPDQKGLLTGRTVVAEKMRGECCDELPRSLGRGVLAVSRDIAAEIEADWDVRKDGAEEASLGEDQN